jgi:hypothetical protein
MLAARAMAAPAAWAGLATLIVLGSENRHIFATVSLLSPKTRAASRRLFLRLNTNCRTCHPQRDQPSQ